MRALIDEYAKAYKNYFGKSTVPASEKANDTLTVMNYDIGTYKDGKFTLQGE